MALGPRGRERPGEKGETIRGLTAELQGWLAGSGTRWRRRIRRRRWSEPEEGNGDVAAMQGFRGAVKRWGGRGSRGGAPELVGGARGGRRRLLWRTAATVVFGRERERARERKERAGESEREQGGSGRPAGVVHAARSSSASRRWPRGRARASTQQLRGEGRKTTGSYSAGLGRLLAGPASWLGRTGKSFPFLLFSVFCFI